jgi:hypothetical protein
MLRQALYFISESIKPVLSGTKNNPCASLHSIKILCKIKIKIVHMHFVINLQLNYFDHYAHSSLLAANYIPRHKVQGN